MILTFEQQAAMDRIMKWLSSPLIGGDGSWMFYLGGYAGTGKTTLLQEVINRLENPPHCLAPTGKAASVLQKKLKNAQVNTIHHALYTPVMPSLVELERLQMEWKKEVAAFEERGGTSNLAALEEALIEEKRRLAEAPLRFKDNSLKEILPGDVVMVDEASMVTGKMVDDLQMTQAKVLFVGDPGQLPPVKESGYFLKQKPHAMLEKIQRQALDNPIIELSMRIRNGNPIPEHIESERLTRQPKAGYPISELGKADQIITGKNTVRRRINRGIRKLKGYEGVYPVIGEKLICLKNQFKRGYLVNGIQCLSASPASVTNDGDRIISVLYEGQLLRDLPFYDYPFEAHYDERAQEEPWSARSGLSEFDYGYAITVHKSQGSEWDSVVLVDDGLFERRKADRIRWLYTAVTRAKEKLIWLT